METKNDEFKIKLREEARTLRERQIQQLLSNNNRSDLEDHLLEFLKEEVLKCRTDDELLRDNYYLIIDLLDNWMDMNKESQNIMALWVIGTHLHEYFETFPILYINAMRGSGKTRLMRLGSQISKGGNIIVSPTEATLFRTNGTLFIDEFESVGTKEKQALRELLNASYKKGTKVFRMKQKKTLQGSEQVLESFEPFRPICMANIWGMDEVLGDRAITIILEKSDNPSKIKLIENFFDDNLIKLINFQFFSMQLCSLMQIMSIKKAIEDWNRYCRYYNCSTQNSDDLYINTYTTYNTYNTQTTEQIINKIQMDEFINKIKKYNLSGRNLEIFMPLFLIAKIIGNDILDLTLQTAGNIVSDKKHDEEIESKDVMLIDFISRLPQSLDFFSVKQLTIDFKNFCDSGEEWLNSKWLGRALKRLGLVINKRRMSSGIEVVINITKAKEKIKMFRNDRQEESIS